MNNPGISLMVESLEEYAFFILSLHIVVLECELLSSDLQSEFVGIQTSFIYIIACVKI